MIKYWRYYAVNRNGSEEIGTALGSRQEVLSDLKYRSLVLIELRADLTTMVQSLLPPRKLTGKELSVFFEDFYNMHCSGMSIEQILQSFKNTTRDSYVLNVLSQMERSIAAGRSLTEAMNEVSVFPWIAISALYSGEKSGRLEDALQLLAEYFKKSGALKGRLADALVYPCIVFVLLTVVMLFIGLKVVPQLKTLLPQQALSNSATNAVVLASLFLQDYWALIPGVIAMGVIGVLAYRRCNRMGFIQVLYQCPIIGSMCKESDLAQYFLNLSLLLRSGLPLIQAISDLHTVYPNEITRRFNASRDYMFGGMSFWESVRMDPFFPPAVIFTLRRGEEMARLDEYCLKMADYFNKRISQKSEQLIHFIQPALLIVGGLFLASIAFAFLIPIYGSLSTIAGG